MKKTILNSILFILLNTIYSYSQTPTFDATFGTNGKVYEDFISGSNEFSQIVLQSDGKIVASGAVATNDPYTQCLVVRFNTDGSVDTTFGNNGTVVTNSNQAYAHSIALQNDGKILITGGIELPNNNAEILVTRLNSNGTIDTTFGNSGNTIISLPTTDEEGLSIIIDPAGNIYIGGYSNNNSFIVRLNQNGSIDNTFANNGTAIVNGEILYDLEFLNDGKILCIGNNVNSLTLSKLNTDGTFDTSFDGDGMVSTTFGPNEFPYARKAVILNNGDFIVVGHAYHNLKNKPVLARYHSNGSLDTTFGNNGIVIKDFGGIIEGFGVDAAVDLNNHLIVGYTAGVASNWDFGVGCYNLDGSDVNSFGTNGTFIFNFGIEPEGFASLAIQSDNKIVMAGYKDISLMARLENSILSTHEFELNTNFTLYPNPINNETKLEFTLNSSEKLSFEIYNTKGQRLKTITNNKTYNSGNNVEKIDNLEFLPKGIYFLRISNEDRSKFKNITFIK